MRKFIDTPRRSSWPSHTGRTPKSYTDPEVVAVNRCLNRLGETLRPGVWKVEAYPFLRWARPPSQYVHRTYKSQQHRFIPGYLKELHAGHAEELALFKSQFAELRRKAENGEELPPSFGKYLLEHQAELELSENEMAYLAGSMFGGGLGHHRVSNVNMCYGRCAAPRSTRGGAAGARIRL